jgi:hypothetical protein
MSTYRDYTDGRDWNWAKDKIPQEDMTMYDAKFHAFMELSKLIDKLIPKGTQFTKEQSDAVHACARKLADDLTSGEYK